MSELKTYDIEDIGSGYQSYRSMVEQTEYEGDWVAIEDYKQLEKENAEMREAICIHVRECMDTGGIDNDQDAVIAFKNTFSEENYRS